MNALLPIANPNGGIKCIHAFMFFFIFATESNNSNKNYLGVPPIKLNNPPYGVPTFLSPHNLELDTAIDLLKPSRKRNSFLRIQCSVVNEINNNIPLSCYVDTGAQVSVLSLDAVKKINLLHQIDRSFTGKAQGVGNSVSIIGKIPSVKLSLKNGVELCLNDVIILEETGGVELLLGLDVLYKYEAQIDLKRQIITFSNEEHMKEKISIEFASPATDMHSDENK